MNDKCQVCREEEPEKGQICSPCMGAMKIGQHPIICSGCSSVHWIGRGNLSPGTQGALRDMERECGTAMFVRHVCGDCIGLQACEAL